MSKEVKEQITDDEEDGGINLFDYLIVLAKRKKMILSITLLVAAISFTAAFLSKVSFYEVVTTILPPQGESRGMANQFMRDFGLMPQVSGADYSRQDLLVEIFKSRTFSERIIERFNLKSYYDKKDSEKITKAFFKDIWIEPDFTDEKRSSLLRKQQSPLIKINVKNQDAQKAADIANGIVEELKIFINNLAITEASKKRLFFEEQLKHANEALIKSEDDMKAFQQNTGLLTAETQTEMSIKKMAELQAQITAKEIELQVMSSYTTASNPDMQKVVELIKILKKELAKLETSERHGKDLMIPAGSMPSLGLDYKRKFRQLKFDETLYDILVKQYEMAKVEEARDPILIQVIDKAIPPEKKKTTRTWGGGKALSTTMFAFLFSCFLALFLEYREKAPRNERLETLKKYLSIRKNI
jgi:capsule polysaccharide export protein KpsE/RkpR